MKRYKLYINGEFVDGHSGKFLQVLDPSTEGRDCGKCRTAMRAT